MMPDFAPAVSPAVTALRPDFRPVSLRVFDARNRIDDPEAATLLRDAIDRIGDGPAWADAHLASWAEAYRAFGAKPNRTPCSAEALRKGAHHTCQKKRFCKTRQERGRPTSTQQKQARTTPLGVLHIAGCPINDLLS